MNEFDDRVNDIEYSAMYPLFWRDLSMGFHSLEEDGNRIVEFDAGDDFVQVDRQNLGNGLDWAGLEAEPLSKDALAINESQSYLFMPSHSSASDPLLLMQANENVFKSKNENGTGSKKNKRVSFDNKNIYSTRYKRVLYKEAVDSTRIRKETSINKEPNQLLKRLYPTELRQRCEYNDLLEIKSTFHDALTDFSFADIECVDEASVDYFDIELSDVQSISNNYALYRGPTTESNWVILDRLMMGAYPSSLNDQEHYEISRRLIHCGIRTFVCLQDDYDHQAKMDQWRCGKKLRPYIFDMAGILQKESSMITNGSRLKTLEMLHLSLNDTSIYFDKIVQDLAQDICLRLCKGENIYVHCWSGHEQAGIVIAVVLGMLFSLDSNEALARTQHFHDLRYSPLGAQCPQTIDQRNQVRRILNEYHIINQGKSFMESYVEGRILNNFSPFSIFKINIE